jgi:hypothetical protein
MTTTKRAHARNTDPATSHAAAASVLDITQTQFVILNLLKNAMTDYELVDLYGVARAYDEEFVPRASESGIRSRRSELVDRGMVLDSGLRETLPTGRKAILWQLNPNNPTVRDLITSKETLV